MLAAAEQLDYVPNAHAQALMRVETHTVGVLTLDMNNPYFVEVFTGIFSVAKETGRLVTLGNVGADRRDEVSYIALLRSQRVGALILTGSGHHRRRAQRRACARRSPGSAERAVACRSSAGTTSRATPSGPTTSAGRGRPPPRSSSSATGRSGSSPAPRRRR